MVGMAHGPVASHEAFFRNLFSGPPSPALGKLMLEMGRFAVTSRQPAAITASVKVPPTSTPSSIRGGP